MSVWRHITHPDGMTVSLLVTATGLSKEQVRADLRALEQEGKAWRERAPIGKEHLWWRATHRPLCDLDALLVMGLAAHFHPSPKALRAVLQRVSARAESPGLRQIVRLSATASNPHAIVWGAVSRCA